MGGMSARLLPAVLLLALLGGCGGDEANERATLEAKRLAAAKAMGVPDEVEAFGMRFLYVPAGVLKREVDGGTYDVNIGVGFYVQTTRVTHRDPEVILGSQEIVVDDGDLTRVTRAHGVETARLACLRQDTWLFRLPTEAEWEFALPYLEAPPVGREWMLDRFGPLPTWTVSDPHGPNEGDTYVVRGPNGREGLPPETRAKDLGYRFVIHLGYGLGTYGATKVTFRLFDEKAPERNKELKGGYDLRVISMNDRLQARTLGVEAEWKLVSDPGSPVTLTMVPGAYYVYAERTRDGQVLRGKEMKFHVADKPVERPVPIPEKDQKRYGSGGREKPQ